MHQAAIRNSLVGMFVTAKIEEDCGSIVQIVNILFPAVCRHSYINVITKVAEPLLGWYLDRDIIEQGFIEDGDFPEWTDTSTCEILKSRAKLLYAHYNLIINDDGDYNPTLPLLLYKHHVQVKYNQGKPGLDKNTELAMRVYDSQSKRSFETKYILTLIDRILVNAWRAEVAVTVMKPWLTELAKTNENGPTLTQIRRKVCDQVTIDDFVELFAIAYLQVQHRGEANLLPMHILPIPLRNVSNHNSPDKPQQTRADVTTLAVLEKLQKKGTWPCKRD